MDAYAYITSNLDSKVDLLFNVLENNWYNICRVLEIIKEIAVMSKVIYFKLF